MYFNIIVYSPLVRYFLEVRFGLNYRGILGNPRLLCYLGFRGGRLILGYHRYRAIRVFLLVRLFQEDRGDLVVLCLREDHLVLGNRLVQKIQLLLSVRRDLDHLPVHHLRGDRGLLGYLAIRHCLGVPLHPIESIFKHFERVTQL